MLDGRSRGEIVAGRDRWLQLSRGGTRKGNRGRLFYVVHDLSCAAGLNPTTGASEEPLAGPAETNVLLTPPARTAAGWARAALVAACGEARDQTRVAARTIPMRIMSRLVANSVSVVVVNNAVVVVVLLAREQHGPPPGSIARADAPAQVARVPKTGSTASNNARSSEANSPWCCGKKRAIPRTSATASRARARSDTDGPTSTASSPAVRR